MQCILPAHTCARAHTHKHTHWLSWKRCHFSWRGEVAVALGTLRCKATQAFHGGSTSQCCPEPQVSTAVRLLQTCQRSLLPAFQVLHFLQTQNEWTLLLFTYEQTQAKREEMKNHFPTGKKPERLFTLSLTTLQYSLAFPSL